MTDAPHTIRLRGPWKYEPLAQWTRNDDTGESVKARELPPPGTMRIPTDWGDALGADFRGKVLFSRGFNLPTGLTDCDRVVLLLERVDAYAVAELNDQVLGEAAYDTSPHRFEITPLLRPRNELRVTVECPRIDEGGDAAARDARASLPGGLIGEVVLEIYANDGSHNE